jgi:putative glutamine amidotransferase
MPLLGICGGAQAINVALGGPLIQDIKTQVDGAVEHQQSANKRSGGHLVQVSRGSLLHRIVGRRSMEVNTTHHQAIKIPGRGLIVNAVAPDRVIEGIESTRHTFVLGVQWHPEVLAPHRLPHRQLFSSFLGQCRLFRRTR